MLKQSLQIALLALVGVACGNDDGGPATDDAGTRRDGGPGLDDAGMRRDGGPGLDDAAVDSGMELDAGSISDAAIDATTADDAGLDASMCVTVGIDCSGAAGACCPGAHCVTLHPDGGSSSTTCRECVMALGADCSDSARYGAWLDQRCCGDAVCREQGGDGGIATFKCVPSRPSGPDAG